MKALALPLAYPSAAPSIAPGDVFTLGRHRLMCGNAASKADVLALLGDDQPNLVVTSPPYADARDYDRKIECWDSMMMGALDGHGFCDDVQMLINLGVIHRRGEMVLYWHNWINAMRAKKWKQAGMYVWDKLQAVPGANIGAPRPSHEFIFHLNKSRGKINNTVPNKEAGKKNWGYKYRGKDGAPRRKDGDPERRVNDKRPVDSVFRIRAEKHNRTGHPAVFPMALPASIISSWKRPGCVTYDPFCGSGTTLMACEQEGVVGLGMEISPAYCRIILDRWQKTHPHQPITKLTTPSRQSLEDAPS